MTETEKQLKAIAGYLKELVQLKRQENRRHEDNNAIIFKNIKSDEKKV